MKRRIILLITLMIALFTSLPAHMMEGWGGHHGSFMGGWLGLLLGLLVLIIIIVLVIRLFKSESSGKESSSLEILKKRYANGEITRGQYEEMKKVLKENE